MQQAAVGSNDRSRNIDDVMHAAEESGGTASSVVDAAGELSWQSEMLLRYDFSKFLVTVVGRLSFAARLAGSSASSEVVESFNQSNLSSSGSAACTPAMPRSKVTRHQNGDNLVNPCRTNLLGT